MMDIKIYTSVNDRFSDLLRRYLTENKIAFEEIDIERDPETFKLMMVLPPRRPPVLTYNDRVMFCGPTPWIQRFPKDVFLQKLEDSFAKNEPWR